MNEITLDTVLELAEQLSDEEQEVLIQRLRSVQRSNKSPEFQLPVIDLGPWPESLSLRREDWYDDDGL